MNRQTAAFAAALLICSGVASAQEVPAKVSAAIGVFLGGLSADSIAPAGVPGLYEVVVGPHVIYVSEDGKHMFRGDMIDLETRENITEKRRRGPRIDAVNRIDEKDMIIFGPADAKHTVTVFTDIDCGYCRKLHSQMADYNAAGVRVRYLAFPRAGVPSDVYDRMVSVWCADDRQRAMSAAKAGGQVDEKTCANAVESEYQLGRVLGISGTPTIILEDGTLVPGYVPPAELVREIEQG